MGFSYHSLPSAIYPYVPPVNGSEFAHHCQLFTRLVLGQADFECKPLFLLHSYLPCRHSNLDTKIFGGISRSLWTWSRQISKVLPFFPIKNFAPIFWSKPDRILTMLQASVMETYLKKHSSSSELISLYLPFGYSKNSFSMTRSLFSSFAERTCGSAQ